MYMLRRSGARTLPCGRAPFLCNRHASFPFEFHEETDLLKQCPMFDCGISGREIYEDYAGYFPCFKAIFDMLGEIQHLGSVVVVVDTFYLHDARFAGAEASLLWYKDMFDDGRQAVKYLALVQFVEVKQKGDWSDTE